MMNLKGNGMNSLLSSGIDDPGDQIALELLPAPGTTNDVIHISIDENMLTDPFAPGNHPIMGITPEEIRTILNPLDARNVGDILLIEHDAKDKFRVFSGTVRGFYDASGQAYDFVKTDDGWALTRESALSRSVHRASRNKAGADCVHPMDRGAQAREPSAGPDHALDFRKQASLLPSMRHFKLQSSLLRIGIIFCLFALQNRLGCIHAVIEGSS
jgi:hypothetical protein